MHSVKRMPGKKTDYEERDTERAGEKISAKKIVTFAMTLAEHWQMLRNHCDVLGNKMTACTFSQL